MNFEDIPWKDVVVDTRDWIAFKDGFPVTEGHIFSSGHATFTYLTPT